MEKSDNGPGLKTFEPKEDHINFRTSGGKGNTVTSLEVVRLKLHFFQKLSCQVPEPYKGKLQLDT